MDVLREYVETLENENKAKSKEIEMMAQHIRQLQQSRQVNDCWSQTDLQDDLMSNLKKAYAVRSMVANQHIEQVMRFRQSLRLSLEQLSQLKKQTNKFQKISQEQCSQTSDRRQSEATQTVHLMSKMKKTIYKQKWLDQSKKLDPDDSEETRCIESVFLSKEAPHFMSREVGHIGLYTIEIEKVSQRLIKENMLDEAHKLKSIAKQMKDSVSQFTRYFNNMQRFWRQLSVDFDMTNKSVLQGFTSMQRLAQSMENRRLNHSVDLRSLQHRMQRLKQQNQRIKRQSIH